MARDWPLLAGAADLAVTEILNCRLLATVPNGERFEIHIAAAASRRAAPAWTLHVERLDPQANRALAAWAFHKYRKMATTLSPGSGIGRR